MVELASAPRSLSREVRDTFLLASALAKAMVMVEGVGCRSRRFLHFLRFLDLPLDSRIPGLFLSPICRTVPGESGRVLQVRGFPGEQLFSVRYLMVLLLGLRVVPLVPPVAFSFVGIPSRWPRFGLHVRFLLL